MVLGGPGDVEPVNRWRAGDRGEILNSPVDVQSDRGNISTHDGGRSSGGGSSNGAVGSGPELNLQLLPVEIDGALDIQSELGVRPSHHVEQTILLDVESPSDCSRGCGGGVRHKHSVDFQEVSKLDEASRHRIITNSLLRVVEERGWLVGWVGWVG